MSPESRRDLSAPEPAGGAEKIPLALGTFLVSSSRAIEYVLAGLTGIILARALGPDGRGFYSLVVEAAALVYAPAGLGISAAGVYLSARRRFDQQTVLSNAVLWVLAVCALYAAGAAVFLLFRGTSVLGLTSLGLAVAVAGGGIAMLKSTAEDFVLAQGRLAAFTLSQMVYPLVRLGGTAVLLVAAALTSESAILLWLGAVYVDTSVAAYLLARKLKLIPKLDIAALRAQLSFGVRGHMGALLQLMNRRLDVFLVSYFLGTAAVGHYVVAFNVAEMSWWVPLALGTVLFPRASSLDSDKNAELSAAILRLSLVAALAAMIGLIAIGPLLIGLLYGAEFEESVTPFLILVPAGLFYTIHKVLNASLSAQGKPECTLYGGMISVPIMIGLDLLLIPRMGIEGAALTSNIAYVVNAAFLVTYFTRSTGLSVRQVLLVNRADVVGVHAALRSLIHSFRARRHRADAASTTAGG